MFIELLFFCRAKTRKRLESKENEVQFKASMLVSLDKKHKQKRSKQQQQETTDFNGLMIIRYCFKWLLMEL